LIKLGTVAAADYDELRFLLHPSVRLFDSAYPCLRIWEANVSMETEPELIDLSSGGERLMLIRSEGQLAFHRLNRGEEAFLRSLIAGERFDVAVRRGADNDAVRSGDGHADARGFDHDPVRSGAGDSDDDAVRSSSDGNCACSADEDDFDPAAALQRFVLAGAIVDFLK
jgi:hypothetical protein